MLIDTHAHLYLKQFENDREEMMKRAFTIGVSKIYLPNIDSSSIEAMLQLEVAYPEHCFAMMGLHPCSVKENYNSELAIIEQWLEKRSFCAIGEIGIDLYWDTTLFEQQKEAFIIQINWAKKLGLPIVIHSRNSTDEVIGILEKEKDEHLFGIFHCFGGTPEQAQRIIDLDFYLGIGGVLTFKNAGLDHTIRTVPLDRIVLETDAPYLAPKPFRGKRNETSYIYHVAEKLAEIKELNIQQIAAVTAANARKIFEPNK